MTAVQESQNAEKQEWKRPVLQRLRSNEAEGDGDLRTDHEAGS